MGCLRPADISACTTRFFMNRFWNCDRCQTNLGYRAVMSSPDNIGCEVGQVVDEKCKIRYY